MSNEITYQLITVVAKFFGYSEKEITNNFNLAENISSIDELSDFINELETGFDIDIDESTLPTTTFGDLLEYLEMLIPNEDE